MSPMNTQNTCRAIRYIGATLVIASLSLLSGSIILPVVSYATTYGALLIGEKFIKL